MGTLCAQRSVRVTALVCLLVGMLWFVLARAGAVQAAGVVGDGQAGSCTGPALATAMVGGGLVRFNCPPNTTIVITYASGLFLAYDTTIDGANNGNPVTLSGNNTARIFYLIAGFGGLTLTNITLSNGHPHNVPGGCIANGGGGLVLIGVTVMNCFTDAGYSGGGIYNNGTVTLINSRVASNHADAGGGIVSKGALTITNSVITDNRATIGNGGGLDVAGSASITGSQIYGNSANGDGQGGGGGLNISPSGRVSISGSRLDANQTPTTTTTFGGAILNRGMLTVTQSTLSGNSAYSGGGIDNIGTATLNNSTLSGNSAAISSGGMYNGGTATLNNSTLSGNSASYGSGGGIYNDQTATLNNSTLSGNTANVGGGIDNNYRVRLLNVTLSNNSASTGGALHMASGHTTVLTNTILAYSQSGGNCSGSITSSKYSISSDNSCALAGWTERPNPNNLDPLLTALGNYGGPTLVHMLKALSPAKDGVVGNDAPITDQRGLPRPGPDGSYDIGAVERQDGESDLAPRLYLPLVVR